MLFRSRDSLTVANEVRSLSREAAIAELSERNIRETRRKLAAEMEARIEPNYRERRAALEAEFEELREAYEFFKRTMEDMKTSRWPFADLFKNPAKKTLVNMSSDQRMAYVANLQITAQRKGRKLALLDEAYEDARRLIRAMSNY